MTTTPFGHTLVRRGSASFLVHRRSAVVAGGLLVALAVVFTVALSVGRAYVAPFDAIASVLGLNHDFDLTVRTLRLPRTAVGVLVGLGLGTAGALIQTVARNPLASPDIIGITQGSTVAVVALLTFGVDISWAPAAAAVGGIAAGLLIYLLAWRKGLHAQRFILIGVGVSVALYSLTNLLLTKIDVVSAQQSKTWMSGSLNGRGWDHAQPLLITLVVALPLLCWAGRASRTVSFDDLTATALGIRLNRVRVGLALLGVVLAAMATSAAGPISFVALLAPQAARRLARTPHIPLVCSALLGAVIVTLADTLARTVFPSAELPVGVLTAAVGGPYLMWLLARSRTGGNL